MAWGFVGAGRALLVAIVAVTILAAPVAASTPSHLDIVAAELEIDDEVEMEIRLKGRAAGGVPAPYGYAALTEDFQDMLVVTTHIGIADTSAELDAKGFHTHVVDVVVVSSTICTSTLKVASASFDPIGELEVRGRSVEVDDAPSNQLGDFTGVIVSFTLSFGAGGALCVNPVDVFLAEVDD